MHAPVKGDVGPSRRSWVDDDAVCEVGARSGVVYDLWS
jgi:hypothetical protein